MKKVVEEISKYINYQEPGSCLVFAYSFAKYFLDKNPEDFNIIEGIVETKKKRFHHTWITHKGKIVDPTFVQFNFSKDDFFTRKEIKSYSLQKYLDLDKGAIMIRENLLRD